MSLSLTQQLTDNKALVMYLKQSITIQSLLVHFLYTVRWLSKSRTLVSKDLEFFLCVWTLAFYPILNQVRIVLFRNFKKTVLYYYIKNRLIKRIGGCCLATNQSASGNDEFEIKVGACAIKSNTKYYASVQVPSGATANYTISAFITRTTFFFDFRKMTNCHFFSNSNYSNSTSISNIRSLKHNERRFLLFLQWRRTIK